jgi:hypothetical protein
MFDAGLERAPSDDARSAVDDGVRCAACGAVLTSRLERIEVDGSHEHSFVNPAGLVFRIGCFGRAPGCAEVGQPSPEWSWFPPHRWTIGLCGTCGTHVGWAFRASGPIAFWGLVLDRLAG